MVWIRVGSFLNMKKYRNTQGFTLVELILYIAISSIFMLASVSFAWDVIYGRVKSYTQQEVNQNMRFTTKRITYEIRNAAGINSVTANSISLSNTDSARNPTVISVSSGRVRIGYGSTGNCPTTSPCFLTSNGVSVTNLSFTNLSQGTTTENIQFTISMQSTGDRSEFQESQTYVGSAELRSN